MDTSNLTFKDRYLFARNFLQMSVWQSFKGAFIRTIFKKRG